MRINSAEKPRLAPAENRPMRNAETLIAEDVRNQRRSHVVIVHDQHRAGHRGAIVKPASIRVEFELLYGGLQVAHEQSGPSSARVAA
jgi:hypothetical protein